MRAIRYIARRRSMIATAAACAILGALPLSVAQSQDRQPGVSLGLQYRPGQKTGLLVLPISGASGDSVTAILARDLDYSDRFTIIPTSSVAAAAPVNYALYSKLGADGVLQGTILASGWLRIVVHDVAKQKIVNEKDFPLPVTTGAPAWRLAVHGISDAIEEWITGQRGISQTRIAFTRDGRVWTVDSDGANVTPVTPTGMSPQWSPNGRSLVYSVLDDRSPIMITDLATGAQRVLTSAVNTQDLSPT